MSVILSLINEKDMIDFSSNYNPTTSNILDQLFPNEKTDNIVFSYKTAKKNQFAEMAEVHAYNTESRIKTRVPFSEKEAKKFLIKSKILLDEEYAELADSLKDNTQVKTLIFNDAGRMSDMVRTRTLVMKGELLSTGKVTVKENNLDITFDQKVPAGNFFNFTWSGANADVFADLQSIKDKANEKGYQLTRVVTTSKVISKMQMNTNVRSAIFGVNSARIPTLAELNSLINQMYGFSMVAFDDMYQYEKADGTKATARYIPEGSFICFGGANTETLGKGLYGVTPTERNARLNASQSKNIYIMNNVWDENDPVGTWTKAEGVFVPVLADPENLFIAKITLA
jgi:hypothetical protein